jgi:N-acetylglutamate synthase-like GNAT family acetyltransferase
MGEPAVIRVASIGDAEGLQACMTSAYATYKDRMGDATLPPMELDYAEEIRSFPTWVAVLDGEIVGGLTMMFEENHASIANIAVSPAAQGYGLGRTLLEFAEARAQDNGLTQMRLATHVLLTENIDLYTYLGWSEYDRDNLRVYMKKTLANQ